MAIKGKKKPAKRGSQARRRPVSAPRPVAPVRKPPWYRTTQGLVVAGAAAIVLVIVALWAIANARSDAADLEDRQSALRTYTDGVRGFIETVNGPASEMSGAAGLSDEQLSRKAKAWTKAFTGAQAQLSQLAPAAGTESSNRLIQNSFFLYSSAAQTFSLVPDTEGRNKDKLTTQGSTQLVAAGGVFTEAITLLDEARSEAELSASGLSAPGRTPPG
jgi:prophage DNA circulation protein